VKPYGMVDVLGVIYVFVVCAVAVVAHDVLMCTQVKV
jgi:hypothetical protein